MRAFSPRIFPLILVALVTAVSTPPVMSAEPYLPATSPENVIRNMEWAYANRDVDAYAACLASDFQFVFAGEDPATGWSREQDVEQTTHFFESKEVLNIRMVFSSKSSDLKGSPEPDGLIRVELNQELNVVLVKKEPVNQDLKVTGRGIFFFRNDRAPGAEAHFVIARWEDPGTEDSK